MAASSATWRSKLGNKYQKAEIDRWDAHLKAELTALRRSGCNMKCFDCGASDAFWASPKLGIFICVACSDVHRATGAHITCVKNFSTYLWGPDEVALMKSVGNMAGKDLYGDSVVLPSDSKDYKVKMCTAKYGNSKVQKVMEDQIAAATAAAAAGSCTEPRLKHASPVSATLAGPKKEAQTHHRNHTSVPELQLTSHQAAVATKARSWDDSTTWFDGLFGFDQVSVQSSTNLKVQKVMEDQLAVATAAAAGPCTEPQLKRASPVSATLAGPKKEAQPHHRNHTSAPELQLPSHQAAVATKARPWVDSATWFDELFAFDQFSAQSSTTSEKAPTSTDLEQLFTTCRGGMQGAGSCVAKAPSRSGDPLDDLIFTDFAKW